MLTTLMTNFQQEEVSKQLEDSVFCNSNIPANTYFDSDQYKEDHVSGDWDKLEVVEIPQVPEEEKFETKIE